MNVEDSLQVQYVKLCALQEFHSNMVSRAVWHVGPSQSNQNSFCQRHSSALTDFDDILFTVYSAQKLGGFHPWENSSNCLKKVAILIFKPRYVLNGLSLLRTNDNKRSVVKKLRKFKIVVSFDITVITKWQSIKEYLCISNGRCLLI